MNIFDGLFDFGYNISGRIHTLHTEVLEDLRGQKEWRDKLALGYDSRDDGIKYVDDVRGPEKLCLVSIWGMKALAKTRSGMLNEFVRVWEITVEKEITWKES